MNRRGIQNGLVAFKIVLLALPFAWTWAGEKPLMPCPDCGREVSKRAMMCPNCGLKGEIIAAEAAIGGGRSDARNSRIFNIFALINIGERSGTGLSDIFSIWNEYGYERPTITETYQPDQTTVTVQVELEEVTATTQESAITTQEVSPKDAGVAPKTAPKTSKVAPKDMGFAPRIAPKTNDVAPKDKELQENAVKSAVKNIVDDKRVVEKCVTLWGFLKEDPQRTITNAVERLSCSRRSIVTYVGILKQAHVLEHVGPTNGGTWKFLI